MNEFTTLKQTEVNDRHTNKKSPCPVIRLLVVFWEVMAVAVLGLNVKISKTIHMM